jgi:hypothetical protein
LNGNSTKPKRASRDRSKSDNSARETKENKSEDIAKGEKTENVSKKQEKNKTKIDQMGDLIDDLVNRPSKKSAEMAAERNTRQKRRTN